MSRVSLTIILLFASVICSPAQVTVTQQGFATTPGPAVPATPVSPPVLYAPLARFDQGQTQPMEATQAPQLSTTQTQSTTAATQPQPFNFGVAQFDSPVKMGGVGQPVDGKSLGEFARELRQKQASGNARTYTNSDINNLRQPGAVSGAATTTGAKEVDAWTPNNGVIDPNGIPATPPAQDSVGSPTQSPDQRTGPLAPKEPASRPDTSQPIPKEP